MPSAEVVARTTSCAAAPGVAWNAVADSHGSAASTDWDDPDAGLITRLRRRFDQGVAVGISTNLSRPWHKGNHPGLQLARRLKRKAEQVLQCRFLKTVTRLSLRVMACCQGMATSSYLLSGRRCLSGVSDGLESCAVVVPSGSGLVESSA